jgi:hypothetical protein
MRTRVAVLLMTVMMMVVMPAAPAFADKPAGNHGNKSYDGPDKNLGGGQEKTPNAHPCQGNFTDCENGHQGLGGGSV